MKKIVFLINSLAGGGAERILSTIIYELKDDFKITLVLMEDIIYYDLPENIEIIYLSKKKHSLYSLTKFLNLGIFAYKFTQVCKDINADFSFSLTTRPNLINGLSKVFFNKSKVLVYEVATPSLQYSGKSISSKLMRFMIKNVYSKSDLLLANSKGVLLDLQKNFFLNKAKETIYSPIDIQKTIDLSNETNNFNIDKDILNLITIGRLDSGKNHEMMIKSFHKIKNKKSHLYILGEGALENKLKSLVERLSLEQRVFFLGFDINPFKYLKECDLFLFTSNFEGFPTVLIEALVCELPIISTDCLSGPREILTNSAFSDKAKSTIEVGEYGVLTPVDNCDLFAKAIDLLIDDVNLYNQYKDKSLSRAKEFSKDNSIIDLKNKLNKLGKV